MKNKKQLLIGLVVLILLGIGGWFVASSFSANTIEASKEVTVKNVASTISADGAVTAANQATLHFQTGGKLALLPVKEGDHVYEGQTIAQLDTYALQRQLTEALNAYRSTRDTFDQTKDNQNNQLLQNQQRIVVKTAGGTDTDVDSYVNTVAQRIVDQNQANLDNSVINVEVANNALQMATLTSPLNGIVTHEDVTVAGVNVTPTTSFTVADPSTEVFRANVAENDIDYVSVGADVMISLDGSKKQVAGTVSKIYPAKVTLASGQTVYQVDIQSDALKNAKLDQQGTVLIASNTNTNVTLIPVWTVLAGKHVWVDSNGQVTLKEVTVGKIHGEQIEITGGLSTGDKIITDPKVLTNKKYLLL